MEEKRRIEFHFHPFGMETGLFAVEKDESGARRRYLEGIASGLQVDGHGERMTENCIKSFQRQASSGDILLYEGLHGVNFVDDIGKLVGSFVDGEGNWHASFRLYDIADGFAPTSSTIEKADKVWKQVNGLPPYTAPKQKGFSIEGEVPDGGLQMVDESGRRIMNDVLLDGVVLVNRPAYNDSIAHAVYKTLGIPGPWKVRKDLARDLEAALEGAETRDLYFRRHWQLNDALEAQIAKVMAGPDEERRGQLETLYDEYANLAIEEIMAHPEVFNPSEEESGEDAVADTPSSVYRTSSPRLTVLKQLEAALYLYVSTMKRQVGRR